MWQTDKHGLSVTAHEVLYLANGRQLVDDKPDVVTVSVEKDEISLINDKRLQGLLQRNAACEHD